MEPTQMVVDAAAKLVGVLNKLDAEQRRRAISAALVMLGDTDSGSADLNNERPQKPSESTDGLSAKALAWAKKNSISTDQLESVFTIDDDGVDIIAAQLPGRSKRLQTIESYVLCGLAVYLAKGELSFADDDARALCKKLGAFDSPNHFNYVKGLRNLVAGSKDAGWKLTNPGLARAAEIVRQLAPIGNA
jgi:hypothetical protein